MRATGTGKSDLARTEGAAARKRAALEMIARYEPSLKRTARRFSLDAEDADDAYQRALEIVLTKAPTTDARDLIRWTQTVTKHEALAVRQGRERLLGGSRSRGSHSLFPDPVAQIPAAGEGPDERAERNEAVARSREALRSLKPAELRALSLLAEGYSYAEIGELTGFSQTKINRVLAEGRNRFRSMLSSSEDGSRCRELRPLLSAFCDGEASSADAETVREHLRACAHCRATVRTYRAAPRIAIALAPALPPSRSLLDRVHDLFAGIGSRLAGAGATDTATQIAVAGGSRGSGMAALAKLLAICAGAGGAATCVATGVVPIPLVDHSRPASPPIEQAKEEPKAAPTGAVDYEPAAPSKPPTRPHRPPKEEAEGTSVEAGSAPTGAVEYESPPPPPVSTPSSAGESSSPSGSAAGEFGP